MANPFDRLKASLSKTKNNLFGKLSQVIGRRKIDDDLIDEIEETLIEADVGGKATMRLIDALRKAASEQKATEGDDVLAILKSEIVRILTEGNQSEPTATVKPQIWLIVGVNGVGKTTTVGKMATLLSKSGNKVMIAACDTFRAAAIDQIAVWAERSGVEIIRSQEGADPASVAFDAASAAKARGIDYLLVDTAGRLHTKSNLMEELKKIRRAVEKAVPEASITVRLILDGTTGQNALSQVQVFTDAVGCDGLVITKLDGTAKGGVIIAVAEEMGVPVDFIGIGEGLDDIQKFDPTKFAEALFS
jgi:fused signal recognition particle receptor